MIISFRDFSADFHLVPDIDQWCTGSGPVIKRDPDDIGFFQPEDFLVVGKILMPFQMMMHRSG